MQVCCAISHSTWCRGSYGTVVWQKAWKPDSSEATVEAFEGRSARTARSEHERNSSAAAIWNGASVGS